MTLSNSAAAFRVLEIVAILLPLVLVLLQVTLQNYREQDIETLEFEQVIVLLSIGGALVLLAGSGNGAIDILLAEQYPDTLDSSLRFIQNSLFLLAMPVVVFVIAAIFDIYRTSDSGGPGSWIFGLFDAEPVSPGEESKPAEQNDDSEEEPNDEH